MADTERVQSALADRYRIDRELGQGGMATVYLAEDLRHHRLVAIKVLKSELAAVLGADRFVQEIQTTAQLQHPHILPLFDSGQTGGFLYYVMPYVAGETLRAKLDRERQLGIDEAVKITTEVADALDYAHRHGVIHRDIKPENILLHDGRPVVADFGIALAVSAAAGGRMTETGLSLGTPHYMSPEQATAEKDITNRSDVYSLGCVLYEMLTGDPPHTGAMAQQVIMKIIAEPARPVREVRRAVPPNVAAAVAKSLEKLPADRFGGTKAFAEALANPAFSTATPEASRRVVSSATRRRLALVGVVLLAVAGLGAWGWLRPRPEPPVVAYTLAPVGFGRASLPVFAPDGSFLVYSVGAGPNERQLWLKRRDAYSATPIPGTQGAVDVAISPDGRSIAFTAGLHLKTLSLAGGATLTVADSVRMAGGLAWLDDGTIVYAGATPRPALHRIPAAGGPSTVISASDTTGSLGPVRLPGSLGILFSRCSGPGLCTEWVYDLRRGTAHQVLGTGGRVEYASTGQLLYVSGDVLMAAPFELGRLQVTGPSVALADSVTGFSLSRLGTLILARGVAGEGSPNYQLVWVDRTGQETLVDTSFTFHLTHAAGNAGWALSPDGTRLAIGLYTDGGDDIWLKPLPRGPLSRITYDPAADYRPRWSPDGQSVLFASDRSPFGIYERRADGTGLAHLLAATQLIPQEAILAGGGAWLLARQGTNPGPGGRDILGMRLGVDSGLKPVLATRFDEEAIAPSPNGRWIAYQSDETGTTEVFIRSFPNVQQEKRQVSNGGGLAPLWSRDGRELFYLSAHQNMMAVRVTEGVKLTVGNAVTLFHVPDDLLRVETAYYTPWDVAPDGHFIMARIAATGGVSSSPTLVVVENFFQELKRKMHR